MSQRPGRRLPPAKRLDYILIPAPLDLSLHTMTEKSPLPAIIVTPSSPTHSKDFAIAFLATPQPPSFFARTKMSVKEKVGRVGRKVRESMPVQMGGAVGFGLGGWRRRREGYAPISLPISAPASQTEFSIPTYPGEKKRTSKITIVLTAIFVLVFCHMLAHFFARGSPVSDLASTSPILDLASTPSSGTRPGVEGVVGAGAKEKAYAYLGKLEMKQWLGWIVAGKKRGDAPSVSV